MFLFRRQELTKGSMYFARAAGDAWSSISADRPDGPVDLFFPSLLRAQSSSDGVTGRITSARAGLMCFVTQVLEEFTVLLWHFQPRSRTGVVAVLWGGYPLFKKGC